MKKRLLCVLLFLGTAILAKAQPLPYIDMIYSEGKERANLPINMPLKGHYVYAATDGKSMGMMEFGTMASFMPDSTFVFKIIGYEAIVIEIAGTYRLASNNLMLLLPTSVSNPEMAQQFLHFFDVPIHYYTANVETMGEEGYFLVLSGEKGKAVFQFSLVHLHKKAP